MLSIFNVDVRLVQTSAFVLDQNSLLSITVDENSISNYNRDILSLEAEFRLSKCEYVITSEQQDQPPVEHSSSVALCTVNPCLDCEHCVRDEL